MAQGEEWEEAADVSGPETTPGGEPLFGEAPSGEDPDALVGIRLRNLDVQAFLGKGGFGHVYKARDALLGRAVAVKFLKNPLDAQARALFEGEAQALAALSKHGSIVTIHEWGEWAGRSYLVLEFVDGSADRLLTQHPGGIPVPEALRITAECAEALEKAHQKGILHRDIKPANILIEPEDGRAKVTDFGLARFEANNDGTAEDRISGSPPYMSPEQAGGCPVDPRSDIFSLGVTLYELLCGKRPFEGSTRQEVMQRILSNQRTPLRARRPDLPEAIHELVDKATAHAAANRYQSAGEFARELRGLLRKIERTGAIEMPAREDSTELLHPLHRRPAVVLAGIALAFCIAVAGYLVLAGGDGVTALAMADQHMDRGNFAASASAYRAALEAGSRDVLAFYGLGYAEMLLGRLTEAREAFAGLDDARLAAECGAALALAAGGPDRDVRIEAARAAGGTPYANVLLAKMAALDGRFEETAGLLSGVDRAGFRYRWQYLEALQMLGQAYYHMGQFEQAARVFEQLSGEQGAGHGAVAGAYLAAMRGRASAEERERVNAAARRIRDLLESGAVSGDAADPWTSRPLTFFVLPARAESSVYAVSSGLADVLPWLLGQALDGKPPMRLVDREQLEAVLQEQELSALLSTRSGQLSLGHVLGARLVAQCRFATVGGVERALMSVVNVETTETVPVPAAEVPPQTPPDALVETLAASIHGAVRAAYPLRGRLHTGARGPEINIGAEVGVREGMRFMLLAEPDGEPVPGAWVSVESARGSTSAVAVAGVDPESLPSEPDAAWYVLEQSQDS